MTVYKKTHKGMEELLTVEPTINSRLIGVLVLVDGNRESTEINELAKDAGLPLDALDILLHGGYLERKFKGSPTPVRQMSQPKPKVQPRALPEGDRQFQGFQDLYAYMVKNTKKLLGLGGFFFQLRIERADSPEGLKKLIVPLSDSIARKHGFEAAENFKLESEQLVRGAIAERQYLESRSDR